MKHGRLQNLRNRMPGLRIGDRIPHTVCGTRDSVVKLINQFGGRLDTRRDAQGRKKCRQRIEHIRFHRLACVGAQLIDGHTPIHPTLVAGAGPSNAQPPAVVVKDAAQMDFSLGYDINDRITVSFDATNILDRPVLNYFGTRSSEDAYLYPRDVRSNDRTFSIGVRARL